MTANVWSIAGGASLCFHDGNRRAHSLLSDAGGGCYRDVPMVGWWSLLPCPSSSGSYRTQNTLQYDSYSYKRVHLWLRCARGEKGGQILQDNSQPPAFGLIILPIRSGSTSHFRLRVDKCH